MTISDNKVREAKAILSEHRRQQRKARAPRVSPDAPGQRRVRRQEPAYLQWIRRLPCIAGLIEGGCSGPIHAAHLRLAGRDNPGMGRKPDDRRSTPLCEHHHLYDQHKGGKEAAFWTRLGVEPVRLCEALSAAYDADRSGVAAIQIFIQREGQ